MLLMKYCVLSTLKLTIITEVVSFFPISTTTIVKETKSFNILPVPVFMATKRGRMVSYLEWFSLIKLVTRPFSDVVLQDHMANQNHYISATTFPMATKLRRMVTTLMGSYP